MARPPQRGVVFGTVATMIRLTYWDLLGKRDIRIMRDKISSTFPRATVLMVMGSQEPLVESALAFREGRESKINIKNVRLPAGAVIDPEFPAVPLGSGISTTIDLRSAEPKKSRKFAVRAMIDPKDLAEASQQTDGVDVFSDPLIESFLTCSGDPALGTTAD